MKCRETFLTKSTVVGPGYAHALVTGVYGNHRKYNIRVCIVL